MQARLKYPISVVMLMSLLAALLTACGGGSNGSTANSTGANCGTVSLSYWNAFTGPDGPYMGKLVASFNAANPNIHVTMTIQADYDTKLDTAAASDTLPDIAIINEDKIATEVFRHILRPIDGIMPALGYTSSDFPAPAWNIGEVAGHRYTVPLSIVPMTMFYNVDLLKKYGINNPPTTAQEFAIAAAAATKDGNHGFQITTGFPVQQIFQQLLHQFGGTEYNSDATQATWNSPAGLQALQWMKDAQAKYSAPKLEVDADVNSFKSGQVGMIWNGIWQATNVTGDGVDFNGMAGPVPQIGPDPATWAGLASFALPAHKSGVNQCKDQAASSFIKYVIDNSLQWANAGNVPAYNKVRNGAGIKAMPLQSSLAKSVENPVFPPAVPGIADAFAPLGDAISAVMSGSATDMQKALNDAANRADQILAQNRQKYGSTPSNS